MKKTLLVLAMAVTVLSSKEAALTPKEIAWLIDEKESKKTKSVSQIELKKMIKEDSIVLIDLRDPKMWDDGVIEAKRLIKYPQDYLIVKYLKPISEKYDWKKTEFVVYCQSADRSLLAAKRLKELGFTHMKYLEGGYEKWSK